MQSQEFSEGAPAATPYADRFQTTNTEAPIRVNFTCGTQMDCDDENLLNLLLADIAGAQESVHVAMYNINLAEIAEALIAAKDRGLDVGVVMETDKMEGEEMQRMLLYGIPIVEDMGEGLMHDKFLVIDGEIVWTGSLNLTESSVYYDDNNFERIHSELAALDYEVEFEEMFVDHAFGEYSPANTPHTQIELNGIPLEIYFSPDDNVAQRLLALVNDARSSIYILAYTFTQDDLTNALIEADQRGVEVRGVFEADKVEDTGADYLRLRDAYIDIRMDSNPAAMHHKVIIIDNEIVVFGSYNFTSSAEHWNDENVVIVNDPILAGEFLGEFERIFADANP